MSVEASINSIRAWCDEVKGAPIFEWTRDRFLFLLEQVDAADGILREAGVEPRSTVEACRSRDLPDRVRRLVASRAATESQLATERADRETADAEVARLRLKKMELNRRATQAEGRVAKLEAAIRQGRLASIGGIHTHYEAQISRAWLDRLLGDAS